MEFVIRDLAERVGIAADIAGWHWPEWESASPDGTLDGLRRRLASWIQTDGMPCIVVAFHDNRPVGSAALVGHDMEEPEPNLAALTPWLSGLFVVPEARNQGAGAALVRACERRAVRLGHPSLFLYTDAAAAFYERLEWKRIGAVDYEGEMVTIMRKRLDPS